FKPQVRYDKDGDCVEFVARPHAYRGERIDDLVTAFYSLETDELMGSLIKGVSKLLKRNPGWIIELDDGAVRVAQIIRAADAVKAESEEYVRKQYQKLFEMAEESQATALVELNSAC